MNDNIEENKEEIKDNKEIKFDVKKNIYAVTSVNPKLECVVIAIFNTHEDAINYLTNYVDNVYKPKNNYYRVVQNTSDDFDVYSRGYLYKTLECKLQIVIIRI